MKRIYQTPGGSYNALYADMLRQNHLLIAGASGSGKSVVENEILHTALLESPATYQFVLIDPKRVELFRYRKIPHTLEYATEPREILRSLQNAVDRMESRYNEMQRHGLLKSPRGAVWIVIDEYADLITTQKKQVEKLVIRLAQLGRAANIHLLLCTQRPTRDIITGQIKVNVDSVVALRCRESRDSMNILGTGDAATLPRYGELIYSTPAEYTRYKATMSPEAERAERIAYWERHKGRLKLL